MSEPTLDDLQDRIARALYEDDDRAFEWEAVTDDARYATTVLTYQGHADAVLEALRDEGLVIVGRQDLAALLGTITPVVDDVPLTDDAITRLCAALKEPTR